MNISIVIPAYNEAESISELVSWIDRVIKAKGYTYEVIFIDDGSTDDTWKAIVQNGLALPEIKGIRFLRNCGKSAALHTGFNQAKGDVVITMDSDLQDSPEEIPEMYDMIMSQDFDLVSGWKKKRFDPITKTIPTKFFNWATRRMSGIKLHDFNCGLKAYKNKVVKRIDVYGEMHRYIPVIAKKAGFAKIGEKIVAHQKRKYGVTKFGIERFLNGFLDLLTITFVTKFGKRPMHIFGLWGSLMFLVGFGIFLWIGGIKIYNLSEGIVSKNIAEMSQFYIALTVMMIGSQMFLAGFLGELISRNSPSRNTYPIAEKVNMS